MENLFQDTFAHYDITQMPTKWTGGISGNIISGVGTGSGYAYRGAANVTLGRYQTFTTGFKRFFGAAGVLVGYQNKVSIDIEITFSIEVTAESKPLLMVWMGRYPHLRSPLGRIINSRS